MTRFLTCTRLSVSGVNFGALGPNPERSELKNGDKGLFDGVAERFRLISGHIRKKESSSFPRVNFGGIGPNLARSQLKNQQNCIFEGVANGSQPISGQIPTERLVLTYF